ncbi:hypothetical protein BT67DRAFT_62692 [Trichocladium antarcticum]|uniref:Uncharacterized protein n=1 Tax=Trichocladium antarcticum TaxID=1450529 RepID=A0AAN6UHQ5_9PEZI|nr:hypothetical protein BT67DRAFT_62692 [Trichocladium antarcticum]
MSSICRLYSTGGLHTRDAEGALRGLRGGLGGCGRRRLVIGSGFWRELRRERTNNGNGATAIRLLPPLACSSLLRWLMQAARDENAGSALSNLVGWQRRGALHYGLFTARFVGKCNGRRESQQTSDLLPKRRTNQKVVWTLGRLLVMRGR